MGIGLWSWRLVVVRSVSQLHRQASCAAPERTFLDEGEGEKE